MTPMMPPMAPEIGAPPPDPSMTGQPDAAAPPDQGMMQALQQMMMGGGAEPGASTDPQAILEALTQMATSDQEQLAMIQQIEQMDLEESQKQAMIQALQAMIQQLSQDAHVAAGPDAAQAPPEEMGTPESPAIQEIMPQGVSRMSGQPIPDELDIPPGY